MASLTKEYTVEKVYGQVYTPSFIVQKILDEVGYYGENIHKKTILDPSCGDGRFLVEIVRRIIRDLPSNQWIESFEAIYGWDIDANALNQCRENLDEITLNFGIKVKWNLELVDSLTKIPDIFNSTPTFDFIVGNPPYIRIQHLSEASRKFIQNHYHFCKSGSTDTYIAFFELAHSLLNADGICSFITPNTFFYTETGRALRHFLANNQLLNKITNYGVIQLFQNATTYSAITTFTRAKKSFFTYELAIDKQAFSNRRITFNEIQNSKFWQLSIEKRGQTNGLKLGDVANISVGLTTLCDKAYIFSDVTFEDNIAICYSKIKGYVSIERDLLKPIMKVSTLKKTDLSIKEYILFPYMKVNGKHKIIDEDKLKTDYPLAYNYFLSVKVELDKRDAGKPNSVAWYAFGRSQGLDSSFGEKVVFSPMNKKPNFIHLKDPNLTIYSGYCIKYDGNYDDLINNLNSIEMEEFINISSRDFRDGWKAYNKKTIEEFRLN
jgi:adenine-specific DNA-methyltransferase